MPILENSRPTLRNVAAAAGVSHMTVSRVVNGSQLVSAKTTQRVQAAMKQLGYRPDPALSALAAYRTRGSRAHIQSSVLAFLDCDATEYSRVVLEGARREAELHGYTIERVELVHDATSQQSWSRRLFHRGVRGLLFGPSDKAWRFDGWNWPEFAAVSLGALSHEPAMHSVSMDYFEGAMSGFAFLRSRGCKRIALVVDPRLDTRTGSRWLGGYCAAANQAGRTLLWAGNQWHNPALKRWLKRERVDGVLTVNMDVCKTAQSMGISVAFLNNIGCDPSTPRLELDPMLIGIEGVRLLHHLVIRRELGLPAEPKRITLRGVWKA